MTDRHAVTAMHRQGMRGGDSKYPIVFLPFLISINHVQYATHIVAKYISGIKEIWNVVPSVVVMLRPGAITCPM